MISQKLINQHLNQRSCLSYLLLPLSLIYSIILILRRLLYHFFPGLKRTTRIPLISIGNISSGGTGKTPFVLFLSRLLLAEGYKIGIMSRGYKGKFEHMNVQISDESGLFPEAKDAGDEPFFIAEQLRNVPMIVGKNRLRSIEMFEEKYPYMDFIILDDAYQFLKLKYTLSFLVFNGLHPLGNGFVLPAGILREPFFNRYDSHAFVLNSYDKAQIKLLNQKQYLFQVSYQITRLYDKNNNDLKIETVKNSRNYLMSAIGIPQSFEHTLSHHEIPFLNHFTFPDHYDYQDQSVLENIRIQLKEHNVDFIICTEKDFVKLQKNEIDLPLIVVHTEFYMNSDDRDFLKNMIKTIK